MNRLIVIAICLLISTASTFQFEEDDYSEAEEEALEEKSLDEKAPIFDLKDAPKLFEKFKKDFNKEYKNKEDNDKHYKNFVSNLKYINQVNGEGGSFSSDINMFSDLGDDEVASLGDDFQ